MVLVGLQSDFEKIKQKESKSDLWNFGIRVYDSAWGRWHWNGSEYWDYYGKKDQFWGDRFHLAQVMEHPIHWSQNIKKRSQLDKKPIGHQSSLLRNHSRIPD